MAGKIPVGDFNTRISLDGEQPIQTLKSLKNEVSSATSAWKAQVAELKSAGDQLGAAKAKYEGLGDTLKKQQSLLEKNKAELNSLKDAQSKVDTATEKGRNEYERYSKEIATAERNVANATTRIAKLSQQQEKARNSLDYYKSGLASAQSELRKISESSNAYVGRLEAEGKHEEANKAKLSGLSREYDKLNEVYKIQSNELAKIASEAGKSSEAYRRQKVRVDETATSLAKTKSEMSGLSSEMKKTNPSIFDKIKAKITGVKSEAKETHSVFGQVFGANILSNVAQSAWGHLTSAISSAKDEAKQYSLEQETMLATWHTLTGSAKEGQKLVDMTTKMAIAANNSVSMVDQLNQKFYSISKNADVTGKLTKSVLTLQDAFGATDDAVKNFGVQFSQMMANGKVSSQDMMSFVNVFPVLRTNLLKAEQSITHNSKLTMSQMNDLMSAGKITSKTMEQVLQDTAKQYQGATENFGKTIPGMIRTVKSQMPVLLSAISNPLTKAANPIVGRISDWITSKDTKNAFSKLGKTFSDGLNKTLSSMSKGTGKNAGKNITDTLNRGLEKLNGLIKKTFNFLSAHGKDLASIVVDVGKLSGAIGKQVWKDFADIISTIGGAFGLVSDKASKSNDPLAKIADVVHNLAKNKTAIKLIAGYLVTMSTIKTLSPLATGLKGIAKGGKGAYKGVKALHDGFKGLDSVKDLKGPERILAKIGSGAKTAFSKISSGLTKIASAAKSTASKMWSSFKDVFAKIGSGAKNALSGKSFGGAFQSLKSAGGFSKLTAAGKVATGAAGVGVALDAGSSILSAFKDKKGSMKQYQDAGKGIGSAIGGGIGLMFGGPMGAMIGSQIGKLAGGWGGKATKKFLNGWKSKKPPKNFWSIENLGWSTKDALSKAGKGIDSWWKGIQKSHKKAQKEWQKIDKLREKQRKKQQKAWNNYWKKVGKGWNNYWSKVGKNTKDGVKKMQKGIGSFTKKAKKSWSKHWKDTQKTVQKWSKNIHKNYNKGIKHLKESFKSYAKKAKKSWGSHWNNLHKSVGDFWNKSKKVASEGTKKLLGQDKDYSDKSGKEWLKHHSYVNQISDDFQKNLKKSHGNMFDALKKTTGDSLGNIAHNFGDKWDTIKKDTGKKWDDMKSNASKWGQDLGKWFGDFNRDWQKGWSNLSDGVSKIFSDLWDNMTKLGKNAINGLIDIVNGGISAVDWVIEKFGGSSNTVKHIKKLATGTGYFGSQRRAITEPTLAIVNDGNDSPETGNKEALYRPATGEFGIYQGINTPTILMPGDEILNASDTKMLMENMGIAHFANGGIGSFFSNIGKNVGNFFSGIGSWAKNTMDGMKKFFDLAKKIVSGPQKYLDGIFKWTGVKGLSRGAFHTMITKGFDKGKKQVSDFWKTLWNMVSSSLDGEAEGGLLGAVEKYGKGKPYVWGAEGPDSFDCSGLVKYALEKAFGKSFPHYSGDQYAMSRGVKDPQIGDLVFFGPGGRNHVGVYAGNGKVWSAMSPSSGIGMANVSDFHEGTVSYRRIPGLKNEGGEGNVKANSNLEKFIKGLPGMGGFFKFISKIGDLFGIAADAKDPAGTGAERWGEDIKKAAETMHTSVTPTEIRKIISMIAGESNGNPRVTQPGADPDGDGSGPARGLLQYKTSTFNAYKVKGHGNIYHGWDQLLALFNDSNWRNDIHFGAGWGPTGHKRYANGGLANEPSIFGEAGLEMAIPLSAVKSSRSYELLGKTAAIVAARDNVQPAYSNNNLGEKLDKVIDLLTAILTSPSTVETSINMDKQALGNSITEVVNARMRLNSINREKGISVIR